MARVKVKHGSEGPHHDPYSFTEVTFYFTNDKRKPITYHSGLGEWVKHGRLKYYGHHNNALPSAYFERMTGMSPLKAAQIPDIIFNRYLRTLTPKECDNVMMCIEAAL